MPLHTEDILRLLAACAAGGLIGPEDKIDELQNRIMYDEHIRSLKRT